jgi:hypothetical protein
MILLRTILIPLIHHSHLSNYILLFNITLKVDTFLKYVSLAYFAKIKVGLPNNIFLYISMTANNIRFPLCFCTSSNGFTLSE